MTRALTLLFCCVLSLAKAQTPIQWASSLVEYSSQKGNKANAANKVLGSPNAMPQGGQNANAWEPHERANQFVIVSFAVPMPVERVLILENYMPGSVTKVTAYDPAGTAYVLATYKEVPVVETSRVLTISMAKTAYSVSKIRVDMNPLIPEDNPQIDAIGIQEKAGPYTFIEPLPNAKLTERPQRLSADINSSYPEDAPLVSYDETTLYFSRGLHPQNVGGVSDIEDIWACKMQPDSTWGKPFNIGPPLNNKSANFIFSETKDGKTLLLGNIYGSNGRMQAGASIVRRKPDGTYDTPSPLRIKDDYNLNSQVDYFMGALGDVLIISEERRDALGDRDLYVSFIQPDSTWSEPLNLGPNVNTASDEFAPFLAPDNRALYFSTAGRPGYGNVDIFVCYRLGDGWTRWTEPYNLGNKVNGIARDSYFSIPARGQYAYFTADNAEATETNIFRVKYPRVLNTNIVFLTKKAEESAATVAADFTKPESTTPVEPSTAQEVAPSQAGTSPDKPATAQETSQEAAPAAADKAPVRGRNRQKATKGNTNASAESAAAEAPKFAALPFGFAQHALEEASAPRLDSLAAYLKANPKTTVLLKGYADAVGSHSYNLQLSAKRAKAVAAFLKQQGIATSRSKARGYGEENPVGDNQTDEGRALNRRVEIEIKGR